MSVGKGCWGFEGCAWLGWGMVVLGGWRGLEGSRRYVDG